MDENNLRLSVDSGATAARVLLYRDVQKPVAQAEIPGINYTERGTQGLREFFRALAEVVARWGEDRVQHVIVAMAGAGRAAVRARALADTAPLLSDHFPQADLYLVHDGHAALWAATGGGQGLVIAAGTGSIAFGVDDNGVEGRCGGWGRLVGDEGSAYWIAARACNRIFRAEDGRGEATMLSSLVEEELRLPATSDLVDWLHAPQRTKVDIAGLARVVSHAADMGDAVSREILLQAGDELAAHGTSLLRRLTFGPGVKVGLTGSVLFGQILVRDRVEERLKEARPDCAVISNARAGEVGAALLLESLIARKVAPDITGK